jgi:hypothetical protein
MNGILLEDNYSVMNVVILCDIAPYSPYVKQRSGGIYYLHLQGRKSAKQETSVWQVARQ